MQTLTIALEKIEFFPPTRVTDDTSVLTLKNLVFEPLCRWEHGRALPGLFQRWEHSADGRTWRFHLRPGAVFHDGAPCTVEHVIEFIQGILRSVDTFGMPWSYSRYFAGAVFSALSADCLLVEHPHPFADITDIFSEFYICRAAADGAPILGTGPYRVTEWTRGSTAVLERVAPGVPARLLVQACPDADQRWHALRDGAADVAHHLERASTPQQHEQRFQWFSQTSTLSVMSYLNASHGPFTSAAARLAINLAVDKQAIIDQLFHGLGTAASTIVSPFHLGHAQASLAPLPYDPARASELFAQAAFPGEIVLRTPDHMPEKADQITQMVAQSLGDIGIRTRLELQPDRPEYARQIGRKEMGDVAIFDSSPHSTYRVLNDKISSATRGVWWQGHDDPALEALITAANHAVSGAARAAAYGRCLARLHTNPPWLYLFHPVELSAARAGLHGISLNHKGLLVIE